MVASESEMHYARPSVEVAVHVIAVISQKGGAGKTTLSLSLAVAAHLDGLSVVVVDLDPQSSAAMWGDARQEDAPVVVSAHAPRLPAVLEAAAGAGADWVLIDTPPRASETAMAAAKAADLVVVPCRPTNLDIQTVSTTLDLLALGTTAPVLCVFNAVPARGPSRIEAEEVLGEHQNLIVSPVSFGHRIAFDQAIGLGLTPQESASGGKASLESRALYEVVREHLAPQEAVS